MLLYALLLRNLVDSAAEHNSTKFWTQVALAATLVAAQIVLRATIRWLNELSKSSFENLFKARLMKNILRKDYAGVSAVHFGEWLNSLTNDTISFGTMTAITQLISQIQSPFANITGYLPRFYAMTASAERLTEIESFEDNKDEAMTSGENRSFYAYKLESIGLRNADFTYFPNVESVDALSKDDQRVVLRNISLEIRKGDYIAFTGHSGCGNRLF